MYEIIYHDKIRDVLTREFSTVRDNLQIISAYCKTAALSYVDSKIALSPVAKRLMVRYRLDDILSGATDLDIYEYCKQSGWQLHIQLDLHAKTFIFDRKRWIVGSANLTSKGIGLFEDSNLEMAILADFDADELHKINDMFSNSILMTDDLYHRMKAQIANIAKERTVNMQWDNDILALANNTVTALFMQDFPKSFSPKTMMPEDYLMLGLSSEAGDHISIGEALQASRCFKWLTNQLETSDNGQLYFGAISASLHNSLVNDPNPYRKEVKDLLANLLNWIIELGIEQIVVERPNRSQLVRLNKRS